MKKYIGYYSLWAFMHLVFLAIGWNGDYHEKFWPFQGSSNSGSISRAYDFSEFLVYVLGPIIIIFALDKIIIGGAEDRIDEELKKRSKDN